MPQAFAAAHCQGRCPIGDRAHLTAWYAAERRKPFAHWIATESLDSAYALADGSRYAELREQWLAREAERESTLKRLRLFEGGEAAAGSSADGKSKGITNEKFVGIDHRSAHQGVWDLFYIPKNNVESD
ncbi:hypothetical protein [Cupriavidus sp. MP-37]|uniref:hypothetical protein n=1 Tax=Cupriavidus sp. MP-37 TaxID=2884455 RepID=UPI001D09CEF6|nr:hypothetical protein [Cupriavidus sp. MP-37]UDM50757.1 hypothetical protein LIN44_02890 [Cupriavidus sp. MP-37]